RRRDGAGEPRPADRFATGHRVDSLAEGSVGGTSKIEALADPVRVDREELPVAVDQRTAGRTRCQGSGVLDASANAASAGPAERLLDRRDAAHGDSRGTGAGRGEPEHDIADGGLRAGPGEGGGTGRVDLDHGETAVPCNAA